MKHVSRSLFLAVVVGAACGVSGAGTPGQSAGSRAAQPRSDRSAESGFATLS